jgi:hypothetical protein
MITTIFLHKKGGEKIMDCFDLVWFLAKNVLDRKGLIKKQGRGKASSRSQNHLSGHNVRLERRYSMEETTCSLWSLSNC